MKNKHTHHLAAALFLLLAVLLLPVTSQAAAAKKVSSLTIKKGQTYEIYTNYMDAACASVTPLTKGTSYDVVFYSSTAGCSSNMYIDHRSSAMKKFDLWAHQGLVLNPDKYPDYEFEGAECLTARIRVNKGSVKLKLYSTSYSDPRPPKLAKFKAKKVTHPVFTTYTLKKGRKRRFVATTDKKYLRAIFECQIRAKTGTTVTESWKRTASNPAGSNAIKISSTKAVYKNSGSKRWYTWGPFTKKSGSYRYISYINYPGSQTFSANTDIVFYFPYHYGVKAKY